MSLKPLLRNKIVELCENGFGAIPIDLKTGLPPPSAGNPGQWDRVVPNKAEAERFRRGEYDAVALLLGERSNGLFCIDFDAKGILWKEFQRRTNDIHPRLIDARFHIEQTPNDGVHLIGLLDKGAEKSRRIKSLVHSAPNSDPITVPSGKTLKPVETVEGKWVAVESAIELLFDGAQVYIAPTFGYRSINNEWHRKVEPINQHVFDSLIDICKGIGEKEPVYGTPLGFGEARNEILARVFSLNPRDESPTELEKIEETIEISDESAIDDFNARGSIKSLLLEIGWIHSGTDHRNTEHWARPGTERMLSMTYRNGIFRCLTSNAFPLEMNEEYTHFDILKLLSFYEKDKECIQWLKENDYGTPEKITQFKTAPSETSLINDKVNEEKERENNRLVRIRTFSETQLRLKKDREWEDEIKKYEPPGGMKELYEYALARSIAQNPPLACAASLAVASYFAGRLFGLQHPATGAWTSPSLMILAVAPSGAGKDQALQGLSNLAKQALATANSQYLTSFRTRIGSPEGLEDELIQVPRVFIELNEFDTNVRSMKGKNGFDPVQKRLKEIWSNSDGTYTTRSLSKAKIKTLQGFKIDKDLEDQTKAHVIYWPAISSLAMATEDNLFRNMGEEILTGGFIARQIFFKAGFGRSCNPFLEEEIDYRLLNKYENKIMRSMEALIPSKKNERLKECVLKSDIDPRRIGELGFNEKGRMIPFKCAMTHEAKSYVAKIWEDIFQELREKEPKDWDKAVLVSQSLKSRSFQKIVSIGMVLGIWDWASKVSTAGYYASEVEISKEMFEWAEKIVFLSDQFLLEAIEKSIEARTPKDVREKIIQLVSNHVYKSHNNSVEILGMIPASVLKQRILRSTPIESTKVDSEIKSIVASRGIVEIDRNVWNIPFLSNKGKRGVVYFSKSSAVKEQIWNAEEDRIILDRINPGLKLDGKRYSPPIQLTGTSRI